MFAAQPTLRYGGESSFETLFGGVLSIILVVAFALIFYSSFVDVLTKINIVASNDIEVSLLIFRMIPTEHKLSLI